jgi:hypothetical protein
MPRHQTTVILRVGVTKDAGGQPNWPALDLLMDRWRSATHVWGVVLEREGETALVTLRLTAASQAAVRRSLDELIIEVSRAPFRLLGQSEAFNERFD